MLLLQAAAQTLPQDWPEHHRDQIDAFRKSHAQSHPELIAATTHWPTANATIRTTILTTLTTTTTPWLVPTLVADLTALAPTDDERAQARTAILTTLTTTNPEMVRNLLEDLRLLTAASELLTLLPLQS